MVIPIGGGGGGIAPQLPPGPPPDAIEHRFRKIKTCLVVLMIALVVKFFSGMWLNPNAFFWIYSSLNPIMTTLVGIWLLNYTAPFDKWHRCLVSTCCQSCADQCQGGPSACLCTWFMVCLIDAIFAILPFNGSDIMIVIGSIRLLSSDSPSVGDSPSLTVCIAIFATGTLCAFLSQAFGAYEGWMAIKQSQEFGPQAGGEWADAGGRYSTGFSGGYPGGGGYGGQSPSAPPAPASAPRQNQFQAFQGTGNRLGS
mmetsp:Transcript_107972/g.170580  ORF Transcript_107972/g.170580 Transcript_107972/m.170580 type:complete len:254 (+) Transcript_107972:89-850(+)|eukprot:CAMPEP_0169208226 /NCGR_PEP_ID=MMETSP1016-20121227/14015_1 /TAXON_ID=342587 /ORGANISM="Karlodinium micrum, Strain CCMP2283" /LENGTH=253 /DNA_ID=CAMNT_0009285579 /DNA_START=8 /DNA_END=769 /DNA_ORIENTATION=+